MNIDDPRLTAYALEDCEYLASEDREAIEAALATDPKLAREIDELRQLTASLRAELKAEKGEALTPAQRTEVLSSVVANGKVVATGRHRWWRSQVMGLSVAACAVIGLSAAVYYQAEQKRYLEVHRERLVAQASRSAAASIQLEVAEKQMKALAEQPVPELPQILATDPGFLLPDAPALRDTPLSTPVDGTLDATTWAAQSGAIRSFGDGAASKDEFIHLNEPSISAGREPAATGVQPAQAAGAATTDFYGKELSLAQQGIESKAVARAKPSITPSEPAAAALPEPDVRLMPVTKNPKLSKPAPTSRRVGGTQPGDSVETRGFGLSYGTEYKMEGVQQQSGGSLGSLPGQSRVQLRRELREKEKQTVLPAKAMAGKGVKLEVFYEDSAARGGTPAAQSPATAGNGTGDLALNQNAVDSLLVADPKPDSAKKEAELLGRYAEEARERVQALQDGDSNTEAYDAIKDNPFLAALGNPLSTFSIDVDTASYTNVRRFLNSNQRPPKGAVRIEELVNYFRYDYPQPKDKDPFGATLEVATCPWAPEHRLVRVGIKGREIPRSERPPANLVFLVDVSGSMRPENKLPLVKESLRLLTDQLGPDDSVSIAVYAGASGCVLEPTHDKQKVRAALASLESGGSTNGAAGIQLAYDLAQRAFKKEGANRVILCTDGDFNVGMTDQSQLVSMIETKAKTGTFLSVLGYGYGNLKDSTLEKLADKGNGTYGYIDTISEGRRVFVEQLAGTLYTIAKDVKIQVEFNPAKVGSYRLIGYENRLLAKEDFNDDKKDAGEIGAGHTVTALYEVVPAGQSVAGLAAVDELKYQASAAKANAAAKPDNESNPEMLTVNIRYKQPDGDTSTKVEFPLTDTGTTWERSSRDFRWAAAVAGFGMMLRDSPHKSSLSWGLVEELAAEGRTENGNAERAEFAQLVEKARALSR